MDIDAHLNEEVDVGNDLAIVAAGKNELNDSDEQIKCAGETLMKVDDLLQNVIVPLLET